MLKAPRCGAFIAKTTLQPIFITGVRYAARAAATTQTGRTTGANNSFREKAMSFVDAKSMTPREAIRILMHSPIYFRLALADRKVLVLEFCAFYGDVPLK